jgi:hypothetical protein
MMVEMQRKAIQAPRWTWRVTYLWCIVFIVFIVLPRIYFRLNYDYILQGWFENIPDDLTFLSAIVLLSLPLGFNLIQFIQAILRRVPIKEAIRLTYPLLIAVVVMLVGAIVSNHHYEAIDSQNINGHGFVLYQSKRIFAQDYDYRLYWYDDSSGGIYLMGEYSSQSGNYQLEYRNGSLSIMDDTQHLLGQHDFSTDWACNYAPTHYLCESTQN